MAKSNSKSWRVWSNRLALFLIVLSVISGVATYAALSEVPPLGDDPDIVVWLLNLDFVLLLLLVVLIAQRIVGVWSGRKRGLAGSHLHVRLVYIFSLLAAVPAVVMTVFAAFFFHYGVQAWFSHRVQTAVVESQAVAQAYLEEHKQVLRSDVLIMANDLNSQRGFLVGGNPEFDEKVMNTHSKLRNLPEAVVFNSEGDILSRSSLTFALGYEDVPRYAMQRVEEGDVVITKGGQDDRLRALVKLEAYPDAYLFVGRLIDPEVLSHLDAAQAAVDDYTDLQSRSSGLQITVVMIFVVVGLLLLLAAIWFGLVLARQLVSPITSLISTADRVRSGDYTARVPEFNDVQEFDTLGHAFNRMTTQIAEQQNDLIDANRLLDKRRRFTETVLAGVSSGVIGVGADRVMNLANFSAANLLEHEAADLAGRHLDEIVPEFGKALKRAQQDGKNIQVEIDYVSEHEVRHVFLLRIALEALNQDGERGAILTFDDITELQSAQRKAAWSDVARRIAHEIKNPLTPIQLSAERLKRRYLKQVSEEDQELFAQCTDTIIRHVEDIGRMVAEFSSFARMPAPALKERDLARLVEGSLVLQKQAYDNVEFSCRNQVPGEKVLLHIDEQQIRQAVTNLLQNAIDSVQARLEEQGGAPGKVDVLLTAGEEDRSYMLIVSDNGKGLPKDVDSNKLAEPYVTHKEKGTGLGLAIVKKIMEDHNGDLIIGRASRFATVKGWEDLGGATVALLFMRDISPP